LGIGIDGTEAEKVTSGAGAFVHDFIARSNSKKAIQNLGQDFTIILVLILYYGIITVAVNLN